MDISLWYWSHQDVIAGFLLVATALFGLGMAATGVVSARWPASDWGRRNWPYIIRSLRSWGAISASSDQGDIEELAHGYTRFNGWALAGGGLGFTLGALAIGALAFVMTGTLGELIVHGNAGSFTVVLLGMMLGVTLGYLAASRAIPRSDDAIWAGLRPRRVSDYRARWLAWVSWALSALTFIPLAADVALRAPLALNGLGSPTFPALPIAIVFGAWTLAIPTLSTFACRWIVESPRAMTARDPQAARAADEMRRAQAINLVTSETWMLGAQTLYGALLLTPVASATPLPDFLAFLFVLLILLSGLAYLVGLLLVLLRGRLGGRITGWRVSFHAATGAIDEAIERRA